MKTLKNLVKTAICIGFLFIIHSCLDYHVTTTVHPDGSIDRVIKVFRNDSGSFDSGSMYIPDGEGWTRTTEWETKIENETDTIEKFVLTAKKHFKNYRELNSDLSGDSLKPGDIRIETNLEKKFRWFYTDMRFTENYKKCFPFDHFPLNDFMSESEIEFSLNSDSFLYSPEKESFVKISSFEQIPELTNQDSIKAEEIEKKLEVKFNKWMAKNAYEEFSQIVSASLRDTNQEMEEKFQELRDSIYHLVNFEKLMNSREDEFIELSFFTVANLLGIEPDNIYSSKKDEFDLFFEKLRYIYKPADDYFVNTILMPGELLSSNAPKIEENICTWEINFEKFFIEDYEMFTESRITNSWAIITSILGASILVIFLLSLSFRKKRRPE
jgi:hypothetical protein